MILYDKMRQMLLQTATAIFITKCDKSLLQNASGCLLQNATVLLQIAESYCKLRRLLQKCVSTGIKELVVKQEKIPSRLFSFDCFRFSKFI